MEHPKRSAPFTMLKKGGRESNFIFAIAKFFQEPFFFFFFQWLGGVETVPLHISLSSTIIYRIGIFYLVMRYLLLSRIYSRKLLVFYPTRNAANNFVEYGKLV